MKNYTNLTDRSANASLNRVAKRNRLALAVSMALMAPAFQSAYAGVGTVCIDGSTPTSFDPAARACATSTAIGTYYANSPKLRKFVDTVAGLTSAGANTFASGATGEYIAVAEPDLASYPGSEYFVIGVVEHNQRMHSDLQKDTTQRSYVQLYPSKADGGVYDANGKPLVATASAYAGFGAPPPGKPVALTYPGGTKAITWPDGTQVYGYDKAHYLGPIVITSKGTPVRIKFVNFLPNGSATTNTVVNANGTTTKNVTARNGDMFLPTDESLAGAGLSADKTNKYPQNRVAFHLHGGDSPWISDGTPHQWIAASGENSPNQHGDRFMNAPDMPYPGDGAQNTFWPNDQSSRLMWYHDHTFGLTRQNAYSGAAAGYVIYDAAELALIYGGIVNGVTINKAIPNTLLEQIVLVVQDKGFVPNDIAVQDSKWDQKAWGQPGDLWYPHVYEPFQLWNASTPALGTQAAFAVPNPAGRWDYAVDDATGGYRVPNAPLRNDPDYGMVAFPDGTYTGGPSATPESYMDTPVVNGIAYPVLNVDPKAYRVRFLNGANDRYWNLSLWKADSTVTASDGRTNTEIKMIPELVPSAIAVSSGGTGYVNPQVSIVDNVANGTGWGASATATVDATGAITAITLVHSGSGYVNPQVVITEAGRVAGPNDAVVSLSTVAGRPEGIPDPANAGPNVIRFANEGGLLQAPVVHKPKPMTGFMDPLAGFTLARDAGGDFYLGGAERADTVIDFSQFAGQTLIVYNDSSAPVPGGDSRYDYYTNDPDQSAFGGAPTTLPGFGPNTRTVMQIRVAATQANGAAPAPAYDAAGNGGALATELPKAYAASADAHVLADGTLPTAFDAATSSMTLNGASVALKVKTIRGFTDPNFGRLIAQIGAEIPLGDPLGTPLGYIDTPTDIISDGETQYWWIKNNDVDNHPMHFHLFNVQVVARIDHATGAIVAPQPDETGWKETVKNWPLEDVIVAVKPKTPALPFGLPKSVRNLDPTLPTGAATSTFSRPGVDMISAFYQNDIATGLPLATPLVNSSYDFDWEYVWHCHILGHEENDLMRPMVFHPATPTVSLTGPTGVGVDASGKVTWIDPTPALDSTGTASAATKGNRDNEIGFRVERASVTTSVDSTGNVIATPGGFAALAPKSPVVDARVNTLANATSFQDTPAKYADYAYHVVSVNEGGIVTSNPFTLAQAPATPTLVAVDATGKVTWTDASTNETGFRIERAQVITDTGSAVAGSFAPVGSVTANTTSLKDVPLANTDYQYRVFAVNAAATPADSTASATASLSTLPAAPTISSVDAAGLVTWIDNATNETGYFVERATVTVSTTGVKTVGSWGTISGTANLKPNAQTFAGPAMLANTDYQYRVTAVNAMGNVVSPAFDLSATVPAAVGSVSVTSAGVVTWLFSSTSSVTNYQVNRATVTGGVVGTFATLATVAATLVTYTDTTVAANTDYQYQVVALKGAVPSITNPVATLAQAPLAATGLTASLVTGTTLTLTWVDGSTNEDGFSVESSTDGGTTWLALAATPVAINTTSYAVTGLTPGSYYTFRVGATKNLSGYVPTYTTTPVIYTPATLVAPVVTALSSLVGGASQAQVTWTSASIGQTGFTVERCAGTTATCAVATANWTLLTTVSGTTLSYLDTTLASGATYVYRVKAMATNTSVTPNVTTAGPLASSGQTATPVAVAAPSNLTAVSPTGVGVTLSWLDNSTNETSFNVYRTPAFAAAVSVTRSAALKAATGGIVSYVDATALAGTLYSYYVVAVNTTGTTVSASPASNTASVTLALPAPTGLSAVQSAGNMVLSWTDTSATETAFEVLRTDISGLSAPATFTVARTAAQTTSVNAVVTYSDVAAIPGTVYTYAVRAVNTPVVVAPAVAGPTTYSGYTASVTASVVIPTPTQLTAVVPATGTGVMLNWVDNATFETGYRIDRAVVTLDAQGNVPAGTVYTPLLTLARTGNVVRTTGAVAYTDLTATALTAPQAYAYRVAAAKTTALTSTVNGVATTTNVIAYSTPSNEASTNAAVVVTGAPTALTANTSSGTSIVLTWIDNTTVETAYQVTRKDPAGVAVVTRLSVIAGSGKTGTFTDATAVVGVNYTYEVAALVPVSATAPLGTLAATVTAGLTLNAPLNATAAQTATGITIGWTDNSKNEIGFQIVRTGVTAAGVVVAPATFNVTSTAAQKTATGTVRTYIDTTAVPGVTYTYTVATTGGTTALPVYSAAVSTTPLTITETIVAPSTPTAVITTATRITVSWTDLSTNETGFLVERSQDGGKTFVTLATVARTGTATTGVNGAVSYVDNLVAPVVYGQYQYRVSAVNATGTGATAVVNAASTAVASNMLDFTLPAAPTVLTVTAGAVGSGAVTLGWTDNATNETGYTVQRATNATFTTALVTTAVPGAIAGGSTSYVLNGMTKGTKYFFRVAATNAAGTSAYVASTVAVAVP